MKFQIWSWGFLCHCFCCCGYIFRKINWHILPGFFPLVFGISLAMVQTDVKNVLLKSLFFQRLATVFFLICIICLLWASWVLCLKQKVFHCVLRFWLISGLLCLEVTHADAFIIPLNCFRARRDYVLSLPTLGLVQTKNSMSSHSVRFSSGVLNLSSKV